MKQYHLLMTMVILLIILYISKIKTILLFLNLNLKLQKLQRTNHRLLLQLQKANMKTTPMKTMRIKMIRWNLMKKTGRIQMLMIMKAIWKYTTEAALLQTLQKMLLMEVMQLKKGLRKDLFSRNIDSNKTMAYQLYIKMTIPT